MSYIYYILLVSPTQQCHKDKHHVVKLNVPIFLLPSRKYVPLSPLMSSSSTSFSGSYGRR